MAYMKDSTGRRLDSFKVQQGAMSARIASWHRLLQEQELDSNILVVGDSTGAGTTRWVRLLANKIAAAYPTHTVIYKGWDDPSKTYPAGQSVTLQAGSGARTLTIYNGSLSGSAIAYARDNMTTLRNNLTPDVVFFNYGHNSPQLGDEYRAIHQETVQIYANRFPNAAIVLMTQNPLPVGDANYATAQTKQRAIYQLAVNSGYDMVDVNEAFRNYGDYAADLILPDGIHPNDNAGSPLWADTVWDYIHPSRIALPAGPQPAHTRIWVPASAFMANQGSPTLANHFGIPMWELDGTTAESVTATVDIPSSWVRQNIRLQWTTENGTAPNGVVWTGYNMYIGGAGGTGGSIQLGTYNESGGSTATASTTAGRTVETILWNRIGFGVGPLALRVGRNPTHASDTLAADALLVGLVIDRAY